MKGFHHQEKQTDSYKMGSLCKNDGKTLRHTHTSLDLPEFVLFYKSVSVSVIDQMDAMVKMGLLFPLWPTLICFENVYNSFVLFVRVYVKIKCCYIRKCLFAFRITCILISKSQALCFKQLKYVETSLICDWVCQYV